MDVRAFLAETIHDRFDRDDPGFVEWFLDESARTSPETLARFVPMMASVDLRDRLHEIRCPTLVVVPGHDPIRPLSRYEVLRDRIPDLEFVVYDGLPHNITDAAPNRCAEDLRRFLVNRAPPRLR